MGADACRQERSATCFFPGAWYYVIRIQSLFVRESCFVACGGWLVGAWWWFFARAIVSGVVVAPPPLVALLLLCATPRAVIAADGGAATVRG